MKHIVKLIAITDEGDQIEYEGDGFISDPRSQNHLRDDKYRQAVLAHITLPAKDIKA